MCTLTTLIQPTAQLTATNSRAPSNSRDASRHSTTTDPNEGRDRSRPRVADLPRDDDSSDDGWTTDPNEGRGRPRLRVADLSRDDDSSDDGWGRPRPRFSDLPRGDGSSDAGRRATPFLTYCDRDRCSNPLSPQESDSRLCGSPDCDKKLCRGCRKKVIRGWCETGGPYQCVFCGCRRLTPTRDEIMEMTASNREQSREILKNNAKDGKLYCGVCKEWKNTILFNVVVPLCNSEDRTCRTVCFLCISCQTRYEHSLSTVAARLQNRRHLRCPFCKTSSVIYPVS